MDGTNDNSRPKPDRVNGYNDLEMRKHRLCQFINSPCAPEDIIIEVIKATNSIPLPALGH